MVKAFVNAAANTYRDCTVGTYGAYGTVTVATAPYLRYRRYSCTSLYLYSGPTRCTAVRGHNSLVHTLRKPPPELGARRWCTAAQLRERPTRPKHVRLLGEPGAPLLQLLQGLDERL